MLRRLTPVRSRVAVALTAVALLGVALTYLLAPINGNIRYEAGVKMVGLTSAADTFSHRPLGFRLLMDGIFGLARTLSFGVSSFELVVRLLVAGLAVGAGLLLWRGLRAHAVRQPALHAAVVVGVLVLVGPTNAGEPDWLAVVLATGAAGVALVGRRRMWWWALLAGVLFVAAAAMKVVTLPTALLGLGVVALLDRRQLVRTLVCSVVVGGLYVVATLVWVPWELQWLLDIGTVQTPASESLPDALPFLAELAARRPALALLPAALVLATGRERLVTVLAVLVAAAPVVAQGQYFGYHAIPLLVVAASAVFRSLRPWMSRTNGVAVLAVVLPTVGLSTVDGVFPVDHQQHWGQVTLVVVASAIAALGLVWASVVRRRRPTGGPRAPLLGALATLALLYPGSTPWAAELLRPGPPDDVARPTTIQSRAQHEAAARQIRRVVGGPDVEVTYLTFGEWTYFVRNPTDCRYPSPLFLQRTKYSPRPVGTASYRENLACLSAPGSRWLVWDPVWFSLRRTPPEVQAAVAREWDCTAAERVDGLRLCPRRTTTP